LRLSARLEPGGEFVYVGAARNAEKDQTVINLHYRKNVE